jgi:hypothetical protein
MGARSRQGILFWLCNLCDKKKSCSILLAVATTSPAKHLAVHSIHWFNRTTHPKLPLSPFSPNSNKDLSPNPLPTDFKPYSYVSSSARTYPLPSSRIRASERTHNSWTASSPPICSQSQGKPSGNGSKKSTSIEEASWNKSSPMRCRRYRAHLISGHPQLQKPSSP